MKPTYSCHRLDSSSTAAERRELHGLLTDDMTLCLDMGSFHIWLPRHLHSFRPRQVLVANGQQTLGVALPWAIAARLVRPGEKMNRGCDGAVAALI
jgi:thiamine pyrophosphate-dependent acetolactate synthase large subunit-like protein